MQRRLSPVLWSFGCCVLLLADAGVTRVMSRGYRRQMRWAAGLLGLWLGAGRLGGIPARWVPSWAPGTAPAGSLSVWVTALSVWLVLVLLLCRMAQVIASTTTGVVRYVPAAQRWPHMGAIGGQAPGPGVGPGLGMPPGGAQAGAGGTPRSLGSRIEPWVANRLEHGVELLGAGLRWRPVAWVIARAGILAEGALLPLGLVRLGLAGWTGPPTAVLGAGFWCLILVLVLGLQQLLWYDPLAHELDPTPDRLRARARGRVAERVLHGPAWTLAGVPRPVAGRLRRWALQAQWHAQPTAGLAEIGRRPALWRCVLTTSDWSRLLQHPDRSVRLGVLAARAQLGGRPA